MRCPNCESEEIIKFPHVYDNGCDMTYTETTDISPKFEDLAGNETVVICKKCHVVYLQTDCKDYIVVTKFYGGKEARYHFRAESKTALRKRLNDKTDPYGYWFEEFKKRGYKILEAK